MIQPRRPRAISPLPVPAVRVIEFALPGGSRPTDRRNLERPWGAVLFVLLLCLIWPWQLPAQEADKEQSIFRRFALSRKPVNTVQKIFEIPFSLHPQSDPDAEINKNLGFNYISSGRPDNRWYLSSSLGFAKLEWEPSDPNIDLVKMRTFDMAFLVNRLFNGWLVTSVGLGLGLMDGLVVFSQTGKISERLEPFIPIHAGIAMRLGDTIQMGLKVTHFPYFRQKPAIAITRLLFGIGISY